jgi:hypothetical protein
MSNFYLKLFVFTNIISLDNYTIWCEIMEYMTAKEAAPKMGYHSQQSAGFMCKGRD